MIVFTTIINGFRDWNNLVRNQPEGLLIMTFIVLFFIGVSIYGIIKSCKNNIYKSVFPSLIAVVMGFFVFDTISEVSNQVFMISEIGGIILLLLPGTIYFHLKTKKDVNAKEGVQDE